MKAAEGAVIGGGRPLLKTRVPKALLRRNFPTVEVLGSAASEAATAGEGPAPPEPVRYGSIGVGHAEPVSRVMSPPRCSQPRAAEIPEAVAMKEGVVNENTAAKPI
jgi:hypothetical protein